jgi:hypothetical protein
MSKQLQELARLLDERMGELDASMKRLAVVLEGMSADVRLRAEIERDTRRAIALGRTMRFLSGRWPLRDGDSYGIVQAQPKPAELPTAEDVKGILRADDPPGHLRPPDER